MTFNNAFFVFIFLASLSDLSFCEDDLDWDNEYDFSGYQKSTIADFPLQEVGQDELSNAAIEGGLQATSNQRFNTTGKPIYVQQQEENEKEKTTALKSAKSEIATDDILDINKNLPSLPVFTQPDYIAPTVGRTYGTHTSHTVERF